MFTQFYIMPALALHIESQISFVQSIPVCLTKKEVKLGWIYGPSKSSFRIFSHCISSEINWEVGEYVQASWLNGATDGQSELMSLLKNILSHV